MSPCGPRSVLNPPYLSNTSRLKNMLQPIGTHIPSPYSLTSSPLSWEGMGPPTIGREYGPFACIHGGIEFGHKGRTFPPKASYGYLEPASIMEATHLLSTITSSSVKASICPSEFAMPVLSAYDFPCRGSKM